MLKSSGVPSRYLIAEAASEVMQMLELPQKDTSVSKLLDMLFVLDSAPEYNYRGTLDGSSDELFVLQVTDLHAAASFNIIRCDLHNQLGMTFITVVSEFAPLLPWAQRLLEHPSLVEDYLDMEKALCRVRNSYNDYRDQCLSSSNRKREFGLPDMFYVESLLQANGVESTDVQHPAMPDSFGLATGIPFGLFVVCAFEKFDSYFHKTLLPDTKTRSSQLQATLGECSNSFSEKP